MNTLYRLFAVITIWAWCAACSPADWAKAAELGQVAGAALDGAAVARADQIRASARLAEDAAREGDTIAAMKALNDALGDLAAEQFRDLQSARAMCSRSPLPIAPTSSATAVPVTPPTTPAVP